MHLPRARALLTAVVASLLLAPACSDPEPPEADLGDRIEAIVDEQLSVVPQSEAIRAVVVTQDGRTLFEDYPQSSPDDHHASFSVTKSFVSTLIGIALDEGLIPGVEATLSELLPSYADRMNRAVARTTLDQVLTMTAGFSGPQDALDIDFMASPDPVASILRHPAAPPGGEFAYSNATSHLLSAILVEATGTSVLDYARSRLFEPLGIPVDPAVEPEVDPRFLGPGVDAYLSADFAWPVDRRGLHLGWGMIKLRPGDLVRLGQLFLDRGTWDGDRIVSEEWVEQATTAQVSFDENSSDGYGYQWWVGESQGHEAFSARGFGGQLVHVVPDLDLVTVFATEIDIDDFGDFGVSPASLTLIADLVAREVED